MDEGLLKKIKVAFNVFGYFFTFVALVLWALIDKVFVLSGSIYKNAIYVTVLGYVVFFSATLIASLIFKLKSFGSLSTALTSNTNILTTSVVTFNDENAKLSNSIKTLSENLEKENRLITQMQICEYVMDGREVIDLESLVGNYTNNNRNSKIYIQTSKFELEKGPLEQAILWNLRKGVKYIYLIPDKELDIDYYYGMLLDWFKSFSNILNSREDFEDFLDLLKREPKYRQFWSRDYINLFKSAEELWKNKEPNEKLRKSYLEKCKEIFEKLIETHVDDESEFYITVAAYEVKRNQWEAIIKLPSQNINNEYYAFRVPSINQAEKELFIRTFRSKFRSIPFEKNNTTTRGGVLKFDFSDILGNGVQ